MSQHKKRFIISIVFTILAFLFVLGFFILENIGLFSFKCPIRISFGINCPFCGGTRMLYSLCEMDLYKAFRSHGFLMVTFPYIITLYIRVCQDYIDGNEFKQETITSIIKYAGIFLIYSIIRNIPAFKFLAPITWN